MKSDKIWTQILDGDVNFSDRTEMNSKAQIHKSVLFMYRNGESAMQNIFYAIW